MQLERRYHRVWLTTLLTTLAILSTTAPRRAAAQRDTGDLPLGSGGRLWNISDAPLKYRLRRTSGVIWTDERTLAPGEFQLLQLPKPGERSDIQGLDVTDPHVSIEYPDMGGLMRFRLPARSASGTVVPFWFYVKDSNGFGHMIQAKGLPEAQTAQERLKKVQPLKPEEIDDLRATLRANWVFYPARR